MSKVKEKARQAIARAFKKNKKQDERKGTTTSEVPTNPSAWRRLWKFAEHPIMLCNFGILAGVIGMYLFTPILAISGLLFYVAFYKAGTVKGKSLRVQLLAFLVLSLFVWPGLYALNMIITTRAERDRNIPVSSTALLPGISSIGDQLRLVLHKFDEQGHLAARPDPIVHIEPENALIWSTRPDQSNGVFDLTLVNGQEMIDTIRAEETYFVAERAEDLVFKKLSQSVSVEMPPLQVGEHASFRLDFRPYSSLARDLMTAFPGPSLLGVKVLVRLRRALDGKDFTYTRGYAALNPIASAIYGADTDLDRSMRKDPVNALLVVSDGANYFTDSLNAGTADKTAVPPHGKLRLSEVELYFDLPGHWVPVVHEVGTDKKR